MQEVWNPSGIYCPQPKIGGQAETRDHNHTATIMKNAFFLVMVLATCNNENKNDSEYSLDNK